MLQQSDKLACELRAAVLAGKHEKAERLAAEYTEALRQYWTRLSPQGRAASSLPQQSRELLAWVRDMTLMQQAMTAQHLAYVQRANRRLTARALYLQTSTLDAQP
ncbi:MAG: hypothetical protein ABSG13_21470 [Bryobacteraceae bacterium]|jgi:hypothetical protein